LYERLPIKENPATPPLQMNERLERRLMAGGLEGIGTAPDGWMWRVDWIGPTSFHISLFNPDFLPGDVPPAGMKTVFDNLIGRYTIIPQHVTPQAWVARITKTLSSRGERNIQMV
jgi:hypothetical protein